MIYLDHAATTFPYPEVVDYFSEHLAKNFANPAGVYDLAIREEKSIRASLSSLAEDLGCSPDELIVTSGATESINTVLKGHMFAQRKRGNHLITSQGEHSATRQTCAFLEEQGFRINYLPLTPDGANDLTLLPGIAAKDTMLLSFIGVNNETGSINDIKKLRHLRDAHYPQAAIHIDFVQGWNRIPINLKALGIEYASFSAHKIHGPKSIGLLYVRKGQKLWPLIHGGGQQNNLRSGTENSVAVGAMALASRIGKTAMSENSAHVSALRERFISAIQSVRPIVRDTGDKVPHILSLAFPGIQSETLVHMMEADEVYLSNQSACASKAYAFSQVLASMGVSQDEAKSSLRVSFDASNTFDDIDEAAALMVKNVQTLYDRHIK